MSRGQAPVNITGANTSMKLPVKSSKNRKNMNNKKSKVAYNSTSKNTSRPSGVDERKSSSQKTVQDPAKNRVEIEKTKKVSPNNVPITPTRPKCMNDFKEKRIINPNKNVSSNTQKTDFCETISSIVFSMTKENIVSSTNYLILRISSVDTIEKTIDVVFKRATTEPSSIPLLVEMCFLLKEIVLNIDKGATHVSFKKQLAARCKKQLQIGIPIISKETYTMIGELFNKKLVPLNILVEFIIHKISHQLMDASIENICYLLKMVGAEIERSFSLKPTLTILEAFAKYDTKITSEHKDDVMDLLKLRNNKWVPIKPIDPLPTTENTDQSVSRSNSENPPSTPEERKLGKNRRKKNTRKLLGRENSGK